MSAKEINPIKNMVKFGSESKDLFCLDFRLTSKCNYNCWYCKDMHDNSKSNVPVNLKNLKGLIIALNRDMESKIEMLGDVSETSILNKVNGMINDSISNIVLEIRSSDTTIDNIRSEVQREKDLNNYRMSEIDKKIAEIYNVLL